MAAIQAGHDPREVREWSESDIMHYSQHVQFSNPLRDYQS